MFKEKDNVKKKERIKERIWEIDAFRGLLILGVIVSHVVFDIQYFANMNIRTNALYDAVMNVGGYVFVVLSGLCVTLGKRSVKRGLIVLGAGLIVTAATLIAGDESDYIFFGVLQLLGICMITYPLYKKLPAWITGLIGAVITAVGFYINKIYLDTSFRPIIVIGFKYRGFMTGDWFPLCPNLGLFMLGVFLGKILYKEKKSLMPKVKSAVFPLNFLKWCGRNSLLIYLIHQPVVLGVILLYIRLRG